jgi:hypothetical protein
MQLSRFVGIVDLGVAAVVIVAVALPARAMYAVPAHRGSELERFELAQAEARALATPSDGNLVAELSRQLDVAGFKDWAIESAVHGSVRASGSPTEWIALRAAGNAFEGRIDVETAFDYLTRALNTCDEVRSHVAATWCSDDDEAHLGAHVRALAAGLASRIDPRKDPEKFAEAEKSAMLIIRTGPSVQGAPETGSGSGTGSGSSIGSGGSGQP